MQDEETLQLTFNGDGLARGVMAISDGSCNVRLHACMHMCIPKLYMHQI